MHKKNCINKNLASFFIQDRISPYDTKLCHSQNILAFDRSELKFFNRAPKAMEFLDFAPSALSCRHEMHPVISLTTQLAFICGQIYARIIYKLI